MMILTRCLLQPNRRNFQKIFTRFFQIRRWCSERLSDFVDIEDGFTDGEALPKIELCRKDDEIFEGKVSEAFLKGFLEYFAKNFKEWSEEIVF